MKTPGIPFVPAPKTARLSREVIITEKIDGTRSTIFIDEAGELFCGSRNRWITPENDNYGFARWCEGNREELLKLGPGRHDGEWFGLGIQRHYDLKEKRFSLFNASRWGGCPQNDWKYIQDLKTGVAGPACVSVVPVLYRGRFSTGMVEATLARIAAFGSVAAPGFRDPEGIVIYHTAAGVCFKKTIKDDETPKSLVDNTPAPCDIVV